MQVSSTFSLKIGDAAPDFSLPDAYGTQHTLASCRGDNGTLIVFACNHCPYVIHLADALSAVMKNAAEQGIHCVAINSNDLEKYPQDGAEPMKEFAAKHAWNFPYLLDETQEIAKAYGAACTPDFFLFDREGKLYYAGQFDETRPKSNQIATGRDLIVAIAKLLDHDAAPQPQFPASGCNIKWKPGNEPQWFPV